MRVKRVLRQRSSSDSLSLGERVEPAPAKAGGEGGERRKRRPQPHKKNGATAPFFYCDVWICGSDSIAIASINFRLSRWNRSHKIQRRAVRG